MIINASSAEPAASLRLAPNFRSWQRDTVHAGLLPVIAIGGTRGKSLVVRMLDSILRAAHLRTATWTNSGIEVRGRRQQGELGAWSTTLSRIAAGTVDIAIQELHWSTINAVGLPHGSYPLVAVTNTWPDEAHEHPAAIQLAMSGADRMARAVHSNGLIVVSGDDLRLVDIVHALRPNAIVTARSREIPVVQSRLAKGQKSVWIEHDSFQIGDGTNRHVIAAAAPLPCSLEGHASFQLSNAMTAASIAYAIGVGAETINEALATFESSPESLPASFNIHRTAPYLGIVNRLESPGIMRSIFRAANPRGRRRQIAVFDDLAGLSIEDAYEIGRMSGRAHGAVLLHSQHDEKLVDAFRRGIAANQYPPLIIHLPTERRALNRAFRTALPEDVLLVFTADDGRAANRALLRQAAD